MFCQNGKNGNIAQIEDFTKKAKQYICQVKRYNQEWKAESIAKDRNDYCR